MSSVTSWSDDNSSHFRTKSRDILERLVRKYGYEVVASFVPAKHKKFVAHIRKSVERQKRKKKQAKEAGDEKEDGDGVKSHKPRWVRKASTGSVTELFLHDNSKGWFTRLHVCNMECRC